MNILSEFNEILQVQLVEKLAIPNGLIPLTENDFGTSSTDMDKYLCIDIEGNSVEDIKQHLSSVVSEIDALPRGSTIFESMGYVLRCGSDLLLSEYHYIHEKLKGVSERHNIWFNFGIEEQEHLNSRITFSVYLFAGDIDLSSVNDTLFELTDEFISQVNMINKQLH